MFGGGHSTSDNKIQEIIEDENQQHSSDKNSSDPARIVEDVKRIRERIDLLYTAAITIAVVLVILQIFKWL